MIPRTLRPRAKRLLCAVCLYAGGGSRPRSADTVLEGYAVCYDHLGVVAQGQRFHSILRIARGQYS